MWGWMELSKNIGGDADGHLVAARFLKSIQDGRASDFWSLLDKQGQGYFLGLWYSALVHATAKTIIGLSKEEEFLQDALGGILQNLKNGLECYLEDPVFGEVSYVDSQHAVVPVLPGGGDGGVTGEAETEFIPLVLELASETGQDAGGMSLTCWKVDALKCINLSPGS